MNSGDGRLYVCDINTQSNIYEIRRFFAQWGKVQTVHPTKKGMVTVFYQNPSDAVRARMAANGTLYNGKYLRCMLWDLKDIPPHSNLCVKNLSQNVTAKELDQEFGKFGEVISSKIQYNSENESQGYGFVQFTNNREAESAIKSMHNKQIWGTQIQVMAFTPVTEHDDDSMYNNVYVRGFENDFTEDDLIREFEKFGQISSHTMNMSGFQGKRFGFVCFENPEDAKKAVDELNNVEDQRGFTWYVQPAMSKSQRKARLAQEFESKVPDWKDRNVFVRELPQEFTEDNVRTLFSNCGEIESVRLKTQTSFILKDSGFTQEEVSMGMAYVCFATREAADYAVEYFSTTKINNQYIIVKKWKPRSEVIQAKKKYSRFVSKQKAMGLPVPAPGVPCPRPQPQFYQQPQLPTMQEAIPTQYVPHHVQKPVQQPYAQSFPALSQTQSDIQIDLSTVQNATPENRKNIIGSSIYKYLEPIYNALTGKITGMLLTLPDDELLQLVQSPEQLRLRAAEAHRAHMQYTANSYK